MGPNGAKRPAGISVSNNSAPSNRVLRAEGSSRIGSLTSLRDIQFEEARLVDSRSKKVTVCLICLIASISCLSPFVSLHLTQRVGLLLFESDLIQLRSSLFTVIICLLVLVIIYAILFYFNDIKPDGKSLMIQKLFKQLMGVFAIISAISYLAIVLIVPQIRQIQRMPLATFDCNANLITIENCQQQFTAKGGEQTLSEAINELLSGDLSGDSERLFKKLNCLKYNDQELDALQVPTRFLLHKCGLVCRPQRQQSHQFGDDLNQNQNNQDWSATMPRLPERNIASTRITLESSRASPNQENTPKQQQHRPLVPPYRNDLIESPNSGLYLNHLTYTHNASSTVPQDDQAFHSSTKAIYESLNEDGEQGDNQMQQKQVSLKVCFSGEFSGGSTYKQFCITNLANNLHGQDHTLTVGQLNAMLRKFMPTPNDLSTTNLSQDAPPGAARAPQTNYEQVNEADQNSQYMNPVVQFESHFKNWPHLARSSISQPSSGLGPDESLFGPSQVINTESDNGSQEEGWCSFRPIPPFIVNNKPFSDIQCSLEHEYTMTTGPSLDSVSFSGRGADKIYLKKSSAESGTGSITRERCNIQCKVNILYQVHMSSDADGTSRRSSHSRRTSPNSAKEKDGITAKSNNNYDDLHYYLPLKPCLIVSEDGDKATTSSYYLLFRSIGDSTLVLVFILLDLFLFLESIDTKQFQLEAKKARLIGLLIVIALMPLMIALLYDLISAWYPNQSYNKARKEGYLTAFLSDRVIPSFIDLFSSSTSSSSSIKTRKLTTSANPDQLGSKLNYSHLTRSSKFSNESENGTINSKRSSLSTYQLDNYMVPFFVYSTLMFTLAINSFAMPLVTSTAQLIRVSSTEELGMTNSSPGKLERDSGKAIRKQHSSKSDNQQPATSLSKSSRLEIEYNRLYRKQTSKMISLTLMALFLGTQFNLSQLTQTHLFIDSFGHSSSLNPTQSVQSFASFWFSLQTHSCAAIFILLLTLLFIEETSTFFGGLSPFKSATSAHSTNEEARKNQAKFLNYTTLSLLIYSFRFYAFASLSPESSFKWLVVFLFQLAELFNFPLTWFALTTRAHEIVLEYRARRKLLTDSSTSSAEKAEVEKHKQRTTTNAPLESAAQVSKHGPKRRTKALAVHMLVQSAAAFTYFVLARSLALFIHSLNASLYLHSDNVDWFITSFHKQQHAGNHNANHNRRGEHASSIYVNAKLNSSTNGQHQHQHQQPSPPPTTSSFNGKPPPESLFSPLPGERQTYLHASRLFLRYNSLLCLLIGLLLLAALIYVKYQIWADQRRSLDVHRAEQSADDNSIGDQLSLDLMQIHSAGRAQATRTIYPKPGSRLSTATTSSSSPIGGRGRPQSPRAKVLFHYNLNRKDSSSSSASFQESFTPDNSGRNRSETTQVRSREGSANELRIPIETVGARGAREEEEEEAAENEQEEFEDEFEPIPTDRQQVIERITKHRHKRVRIFEDSESWPNEDDEIGIDYRHQGNEDKQATVDKTLDQQQPKSANTANRRRRTISFAPTATLIGHDGAFSEHKRPAHQASSVRVTVQRASPEPSIDNEEPEFESVESDQMA